MGHYLTGDWGLRLRTFPGFRGLAAPPSLGGVGVGASGVEPRWLKLEPDGEPIEEQFLFDLPHDLEARFNAFPVRARRDVMLPVPCRLDQLAGRVRDAMYLVGANLGEAAKQSGKPIHLRFALTPVYELAVWEIEEAIDSVRRALPEPLRDRLSRDALLAERERGNEPNAPSSEWVNEMSAALAEPFEHLLHIATWLLWHLDEADSAGEPLRVVDDSDLYAMGYGGSIRRLVPRRKISLEAARVEVAARVERLNAATDLPQAEQLALRFAALDPALDLSATDPSAVSALEASARMWDRLGVKDRAQVDRTWIALLSPKSRAKRSRAIG
jgi:hypothetical protein